MRSLTMPRPIGRLLTSLTIRVVILLFTLLEATSCRHVSSSTEGPDSPISSSAPAIKLDPAKDPQRVLVVANADSPDSLEIAQYYVTKRNIPDVNFLKIHCPAGEDITQDQFESLIESPVREAIQKSAHLIDFIVTTHGIPLRFNSCFGYSVDAGLMAMDSKVQPIIHPDVESIRAAQNPYFGANEHFSHAKYGLYLVTRLDGYTVEDAKALVDHSLQAKPAKGLFYLQPSSSRTGGSYGELQATMTTAQSYLSQNGFEVQMGPLVKFEAPDQPLMGYVSWGSNDNHFKQEVQVQLKFKPGAIAETYVSTSARTFGKGTPGQNSGGQSKIVDLIAQGVTGVKGYVSEPFTFALCKADVLLARYTSGFNLAESFYAASPVIKWKDVVLGDPLCVPYLQR